MKHVTAPVVLLVVGALLAGGATVAQTRIGQVVLTPVAPAPPSGAPAPEAGGYAWQPVPAGMNELRGRIALGARRPLPAGSRVRVSVIPRAGGTARSVASATFTTTRLPTTYQLFYGRTRLDSAQGYVVRCVVVDASGRTLYRSADVPLPRVPRAVLDLDVGAAAP